MERFGDALERHVDVRHEPLRETAGTEGEVQPSLSQSLGEE